MKIVDIQVEEITPKKYDLVSIKKHIEYCGRTCYASQNSITEDSYDRFYQMILKNGHWSVLEHGSIYAKIPLDAYEKVIEDENLKWMELPIWYKREVWQPNSDPVVYISTNVRSAVECHLAEVDPKWGSIFDYLVTPTEEDFTKQRFFKRRTFNCVMPIGITRELNRHKTSVASYSNI